MKATTARNETKQLFIYTFRFEILLVRPRRVKRQRQKTKFVEDY